ncbi:DNA polymerase nu isoform X2 [Scyliorhinus canicula]|uniref:DNA polymerase nu isoform X2 n=1 Tax=Scyliorhinus canicula TaxID=7830 RepID=UPI0018F4A887|nr:DNA polymerase nu isoform X2 [Scyliorhinus canicula]
MENVSHNWCAGLDPNHQQLSTPAQQIIKAIRYEHIKRMQTNKCFQWRNEIEEIATDGNNKRKTGTDIELQKVESLQNEQRDGVNCVQFQPDSVTEKNINMLHSENQTERSYTDSFDSWVQPHDCAALSLQAVTRQVPAGNIIVERPHKMFFSVKEAQTSDPQKNNSWRLTEGTSQRFGDSVINLVGKECPEAHAPIHLDMRKPGAAVCLRSPGSALQHQALAQQNFSVNQGFPGPVKMLDFVGERLSSVQDKTVEKKPNCLKRKRAMTEHSVKKPENIFPPKQPVVYNVSKDDQGHSTKGMVKSTPMPQICDLFSLDDEQRSKVLEEVTHASVIVLTMVYQDGSSQLTAVKESTSLVSGFLVLLMNQSDDPSSLISTKRQATENVLHKSDTGRRYFHLKLDQNPTWLQQGQSYREFTRVLLLQILSCRGCIIGFKAKDLLRAVLHHCTDRVCWKQAGDWEILDPRIAGWLLDPSDNASCFQTLVLKHCGESSALELSESARNTKLQVLCVGLHILHHLMMDLRAKLQTQHLWELFCTVELRLIPVLAVMENYRIHVNKEDLVRTSELLGVRQKQLEQEAHQVAGEQFLLTSSNQLRQILFDKLRLHLLCVKKKLPRTDLQQQQSTSEAVLLQLQELHPLPKIILEYRQIHKLKSTYVDGLLACMKKGFVSPTWNQTGTVSGRLSAKHPNIQAIPTQPIQIAKQQYIHGREPEMVMISPRSMFVSSDGWTFVAADFSHIELRILAHLTSDPELLRLFQEPEPPDVFSSLACQWKGISVDQVKNTDREQAKRIVYAVVYGAGRERLSEWLGVSAGQASQFIESFLQKYKEVRTFTQRTTQQCHQQGYSVSLMGRKRPLPHINSQDYSSRNQAERQAVNFVVQGSAADICKMAMIKIFSCLASSSSLTARLVAQIHDELLFEVEDSQIQELAGLVKGTMESLQSVEALGVYLKVPLKVSLSYGKSWGSMEVLQDVETASR